MSNKTDPSTTYNQDIERIEQIIAILSQKDCDIDSMLDFVNEAAALIKKCRQKLSTTGIKMNEVLNDLNDSSPMTDVQNIHSPADDTPFD